MLAGGAAAVLALAMGAQSITSVFADQPFPTAQWSQFKGDSTHQGTTTLNAPQNPGILWTSGQGAAIVSGPVIATDGTVIVATDNGRIRAIRPDGQERWTREISGVSFFTHPFINQRGLVVFGGSDGSIRAFKTDTGEEIWKFPTNDDLSKVTTYSTGSSAARGAPVSSKTYGRTLVAFDGGAVFEINEDGAYQGVRMAEDSVRASPMITPNTLIVWASTNKKVYSGSSSGGDRWVATLDAPINSGPVAGPDSTVYVCTDAGSLYAIEPDKGVIKWRVGVSGSPIKSTPSMGADGVLYIGADDGKLYAVDTKSGGTIKWSYSTGAPVTSSPLISANGLIYFGSNDSNLYVLNLNGQLVKAIKTEKGIDQSSPAIGSDGTVYIGSKDGRLYAIKQDGPVVTPTSVAPPTPVATPVPPMPTPLPNPTDPVAEKPGATFFKETGHNVQGAFLIFFNKYGGLEQFGFPRTEEITEDGKLVQYFQRARFEYFPQFQGTQYDVQLQLLGDVLTVPRRPFPTSQAVDSGPAVRYFPEVQHTVRDVFLNYFNEKGALERFGYPISEEMQETNNDGTGRTYTVQYFQRARLEHHPELAGSPYEIQLGLLGDQVLRERGLLK